MVGTCTSMRGATAATLPRLAATSPIRVSSLSESTMKARTPMETARAISSRVLATPLNTIWRGSNPTERALSSSPPALTSTLPAASRTTCRNHRLEQALLA